MVFEIRKTRKVLNKDIDVIIVSTSNGINVTLAGGDVSHIGAVAIVDEKGNLSTTTFESHKETGIAENWAKKLFNKYRKPVVVSAGIHYDNISKEQIDMVVESCKSMLSEITIF